MILSLLRIFKMSKNYNQKRPAVGAWSSSIHRFHTLIQEDRLVMDNNQQTPDSEKTVTPPNDSDSTFRDTLYELLEEMRLP